MNFSWNQATCPISHRSGLTMVDPGSHQLVLVEADGQRQAPPVGVLHDGGEVIDRYALRHRFPSGAVPPSRPCESF